VQPCRSARLVVGIAVAMVSSACAGGPTGSEQALCEEARARSDVFTAEGFRTASPEVISALRRLAHEAPTRLRDDFERVMEASSDAELDRALSEIERFLSDNCGIDAIA
jgi:hypothetical protein